VDQPPYYLSIAMPGTTSPDFSLTTTFMPTGNRPVLAGFMAADSNAGNVAGKKSPGYGVLRMLELPRDTTVKGPGQVQNDIESSNIASPRFTLTLSQFLNNNRNQESQVNLGNLLTLPVGGGLLYVEPIYVSATTASSYPLARAIVVAFGNQLAWSDTLQGALDGLFGGSSGVATADSGNVTTSTPVAGGGTSPRTTQSSAALKAALAAAQQAYADGQTALKNGDFTAYGAAQKRLQAAIAAAVAAAPSGSVTIPAPTAAKTAPAPTPSATAKP
jgi:uncharacterized membrane protein (UPF0182 family)